MQLHYYVADANKNIRQLVNNNTGAVVNNYEYTPFGKLYSSNEQVEQPFKFSAEYTDTETNLVYYNFRYYNPELGRWTKKDPIGEDGGFNLYNFVFNNSIIYIDMLGLRCCSKDEIEQIKKDLERLMGLVRLYRSTLSNYGKQAGLDQSTLDKIVGHNLRAGLAATGYGVYNDYYKNIKSSNSALPWADPRKVNGNFGGRKLAKGMKALGHAANVVGVAIDGYSAVSAFKNGQTGKGIASTASAIGTAAGYVCPVIGLATAVGSGIVAVGNYAWDKHLENKVTKENVKYLKYYKKIYDRYSGKYLVKVKEYKSCENI